MPFIARLIEIQSLQVSMNLDNNCVDDTAQKALMLYEANEALNSEIKSCCGVENMRNLIAFHPFYEARYSRLKTSI